MCHIVLKFKVRAMISSAHINCFIYYEEPATYELVRIVHCISVIFVYCLLYLWFRVILKHQYFTVYEKVFSIILEKHSVTVVFKCKLSYLNIKLFLRHTFVFIIN